MLALRITRISVLLAAAALSVAACSSDTEPIFGGAGTSSSSGGSVCAAGQQITCGCPGAEEGTQICLADGSGYGKCQCSGEVGGGGFGGGAGGQGGATGGGGAGACAAGSTQPCYSGPAGTQGVGLCIAGTETCASDGTWGPCEGEVTPALETCVTPGDDDCDGMTNEEGADCVCVPGSPASCYSGPPSTEGVGPCKGGTQICDVDGNGYGPCTGEVTPVPEDCVTGEDDDCNGQVNDACGCAPGEMASCYEGPPGTENVGICKAGIKTCDAQGMQFGPCIGQVTPAPDQCSTPADDDCSGAPAPCIGAWGKRYGGGADANGASAVTVDSLGNVLVAFGNVNNVNFGNGPVTGGTILKLDPNGAYLWSKTFLSVGVYAVGVDSTNAIFIVGKYSGTPDLGGGALPMPPAGASNGYIAKLDAQGAYLWSKTFSPGVGKDTTPQAVAAGPTGDVVMGGTFDGTIDFGGGPFVSNGFDLFVAAFTSGGAPLWSKQGGATTYSTVQAVTIEASGNSVLTGSFAGALDLGGGPVTSAGANDLFVAKLDPAGAPIFVHAYGDGVNQSVAYGAVDPAGNILVSGDLFGSVDFGGGPLTPAGSGVYVAKFDPMGNHVFSKQFNTDPNQTQYGRGVGVDASGNAVIVGSFAGTMSIAGSVITAAPTTTYLDVFTAKFDANGMGLGAESFGGNENQEGLGIHVDVLGSRYLVGDFHGSIDLGPAGTLFAQGYIDAFVAKLPP